MDADAALEPLFTWWIGLFKRHPIRMHGLLGAGLVVYLVVLWFIGGSGLLMFELKFGVVPLVVAVVVTFGAVLIGRRRRT